MSLRSLRGALATIGLWLALALAATACSSSDPSTAPVATPASAEASLDTRVDAAIESAVADLGGPGAVQADNERLKRFEAAERLIRECMIAEGFEYFAQALDVTTFGQPLDYDPSDRDSVAKYGLGISTIGLADPGTIPEPEAASDPNLDYLLTLSAAEAEAYDRALVGSETDDDDGCLGQARIAWLAQQNDSNVVIQVVLDGIDDIGQQTLADPRVASALADWSGCMAENGYAFADPDAMLRDVSGRVQEVAEAAGDPLAGTSPEDLADVEPESLDDLPPPEIDEEALAEVVDYEIQVALTSFDCGGPNLAQVAQEVFGDKARDVAEQNRAEIARQIAASD